MRSQAERLAELGPDIRAMAESGAKLSATDYFEALHTALKLRENLAVLFRSFDMILTPTAAALPWPRDETHPRTIDGREVGPRGSAIFTGFVNAAYLPAITVPCRPSPAGLPQRIAPSGRDEDLIAIAAAYKAAHPWGMRLALPRPPLRPDRHWAVVEPASLAVRHRGGACDVTTGGIALWSDVASRIFLSWWAADELLRGVNPWRRCLGGAVLNWLVVRLAI